MRKIKLQGFFCLLLRNAYHEVPIQNDFPPDWTAAMLFVTLHRLLQDTLRRLRLEARLRYCDQALRAIAHQRANDFAAERLLHREMAELRASLRTWQSQEH